ILMSSFHVYTAIFGSFEGMLQRNVHLLFALVLIFLIYPIAQSKESPSKKGIIANWIFTIVAAIPFVWIVFDYSRIIERWPLADPVSNIDLILGILALVIILEATRRTMGLPLVIIALVFLLYALFGNYLPNVIGHQGYEISMIID